MNLQTWWDNFSGQKTKLVAAAYIVTQYWQTHPTLGSWNIPELILPVLALFSGVHALLKGTPDAALPKAFRTGDGTIPVVEPDVSEAKPYPKEK